MHMAIETVSTEMIIAFVIALAGYVGAIYKAWQAHKYQASGKALVGEIIDFFDPDMQEANVAPAEVKERFGATVPLVATTGLSVGDIEVVGLYSKWVKYEKQNQTPLTQIASGDIISVVLESKRAGSAIIGLKIDEGIYGMKGYNVRDDFIRPADSIEHEDKYRLWYVFKVPSTIAPGEHTFSVVEGYDVDDVHYADEVCWYEESKQVPVTVTATAAPENIVFST